MDTDKIIDFIIETESEEELKADLKKYYSQIKEAKEFIFLKYFDISEEKWLDEDFEKVYSLLSWTKAK